MRYVNPLVEGSSPSPVIFGVIVEIVGSHATIRLVTADSVRGDHARLLEPDFEPLLVALGRFLYGSG